MSCLPSVLLMSVEFDMRFNNVAELIKRLGLVFLMLWYHTLRHLIEPKHGGYSVKVLIKRSKGSCLQSEPTQF